VSLKAFHLFFIAVSAIFATGFGVWAARAWAAAGGASYLVMSAGAFVAAVALAVYGSWFARKMRGVPSL